ncbi:MAG: T9SS type B sorting domain-containing protein, partial [Saprospiraceae bacterium]
NIGSTPTISSLGPNTYDVTITDALGCAATASDIVNEPTILTVSTNVIDESCTTGGDGQVTAVPTGGTLGAGYTFLWNTSETTQTISGLSANTYTVTVTDANGCTEIASGTVMTPQGPTITSFDIGSVSCATDIDGSLTVNATEGSTPINGYTWSNGQTGPTATNLGPGTYSVSITDDGGCLTVGSATLSAPPALAENSAAVTTFPSCPGDGDATITLDIIGGVPPYNYTWSNGASGPSTNPLTNLVAGTYSVTVIDANLCEFPIVDIVVNDPPPINVVFQNVLPVSCNVTSCDGSATIFASGGLSTNYTFTWESGETSTGGNSTANNLCQGNQNVTVTDGFCTQVFQMDADSILAPPFVGVANIDYTDAICFGDTNGTATVTPTGGSGSGYTFNWSNGQTGATATNLNPNLTYTLTVTDGLGCVSPPIDIRVNEPALLELLVADTIDVSCAGLGDGSIQVVPTGGNPGTFTYQWSPNTIDTIGLATGLEPGIYSVTVTDELGCMATNFAVISEPTPIVFEYTPPVEPICNAYSTVFAFDTVYGGNGPYTYTIDQFNFQPTSQAAQIFAGTYTIEVTDSTNCTVTEEITINEPPAINVDLGPDVEIQLGESYEIIPVVSPLGALDSLLWTPGTFLSCTDCFNPTSTPTEDITYTLTVTDSNGCFGSDDILIDVDPNRNVFIPTAFSPNQDGANDIFSPLVGTGVRNIRAMQVFDRWGELVYLQTNFLPDVLGTTGWDGTFQGKNMNPAVFIYTIEVEFADGQVLTYKGDITLLR